MYRTINKAFEILSNQRRPIIGFGTVPALAACAGPLSTLDPAGPAAAWIAELWWVMLAGAAALFLLVMLLLVVGFLRPEAGRNTPEWLWLGGGGLVLPAVVLLPLMVYGLVRGEMLVPAGGDGVVEAKVLARQWEWVFTYSRPDGPPVRSVNTLHIPAGRPVQLTITSADVVHSLWVPRLAGKMDAIPGHFNVLQITADRPGVYRGLCAEFCGLEHAEMRISVHAHAPDEFERVVAALEPAASSDVTPAWTQP
ncbi:MAG: cytochrome c oxidase subunit II [Alphaproteobacteria bacterium]